MPSRQDRAASRAAASGTVAAAVPLRAASRPVLVVAACAAVAALSLVAADQPAYDPMAWLIWGRQISEGFLETVAGPSWKPLPVLVTAPAALLGDTPAPLVWLVVARTGGLLALVVAFRLARRSAGTVAGVVAVIALLFARTFVSGVVRGNSEGLLVFLVLLAIDRQVAGRPRQAFALGVGAALLRPEAWPLIALQGLWLLREDRRAHRAPWRTLAIVAASGLAVVVAWFVPEKIGSGDFLRAASRALEPVAGSPAQADRPFVAVFTNSAKVLAYPVYVLAVLAVVDGWRRRRPEVLGLAAVGTAWMVLVAVLAEGGFTGNLRYVTLPAATICVLAGIGTGVAARLLAGRRVLAALAVLAAVPGVVLAAGAVREELDHLVADERFLDALPAAIHAAGGEAAVRRCGAVYTGPFQTQDLAWNLHLREQQVGLRGDPPGTVIARPSNPLSRDERFATVHAREPWTVRSGC
jgi:hypothetical protein